MGCRVIHHVEQGLVTGAQQGVGLRLVEPHRTAGVGADLGEGHEVLRRPVRPSRGGMGHLLVETDEHCLAVGRPGLALGEGGDQTPDRDLLGHDHPVLGVHQLLPAAVTGAQQATPRTRSERTDREQRGDTEAGERRDQEPSQHRPTFEYLIGIELLSDRLLVAQVTGQLVPFLDLGARAQESVCPQHHGRADGHEAHQQQGTLDLGLTTRPVDDRQAEGGEQRQDQQRGDLALGTGDLSGREVHGARRRDCGLRYFVGALVRVGGGSGSVMPVPPRARPVRQRRRSGRLLDRDRRSDPSGSVVVEIFRVHLVATDPAAHEHEEPEPADDGDGAFGNGPEVPDGEAAVVVGISQGLHIRRHVGELGVGDGGLAECGHLPGPDADRLCHLGRCRLVEGRCGSVGECSALTDRLVARCTVQSVDPAAVGDIRRCHVDLGNRLGHVAETGDLRDQAVDDGAGVGGRFANRHVTGPGQRHPPGAQPVVRGRGPRVDQ